MVSKFKPNQVSEPFKMLKQLKTNLNFYCNQENKLIFFDSKYIMFDLKKYLFYYNVDVQIIDVPQA